MTIPVCLGDRSYTITVENGSLAHSGEIFPLSRKTLVVTDSGVPIEYAKEVASQAKEAVLEVIPEGEASKSFPQLERLLSVMLERGFTRGDCVLAVGGGVVGDLSGFASSLYMRGIDFYNIPTTLLAEVDSSIGGKTAVDFHGVKNVVGTFWQPKGVLIDPSVLKTLPPRQLAAGMAEAVKMSLTSDEALFRLFEEEEAENLTTTRLEEIIVRSLRIKKAVVEADEREGGLRKILNFGHTLGHGIESAASPTLLHGECVALGMLPMSSPPVRKRLLKVLEKLRLPTSVSLPADAVREALMHDKKSASDGIDVIRVDCPGSCRVEKTSADALLSAYESVFGGSPT